MPDVHDVPEPGSTVGEGFRVTVPAKRLAPLLAALLVAVAAAACGGGLVVGDLGCEPEITAATRSFGPPDASDERLQDDVHIRTLWYDGRGLVIVFTWGVDLPCTREDHFRRR